jgi:hypothetical protein
MLVAQWIDVPLFGSTGDEADDTVRISGFMYVHSPFDLWCYVGGIA